jgi:GT2 family glycosyltransferase
VGGFDERFTEAWREDSDLQFALIERGFTCGKAPGAIVVHPIRPAPWGVSVRQQRKIRFDALLFKKHRELYRARIRRAPPWRYYTTVVGAGAGVSGWWAGAPAIGVAGLFVWGVLTSQFFARRMTGNSRAWRHVLEMFTTSIVIPPLAVFWRLRGAVRYRVFFL